ncbi:nuclear protein localization protein [Acrasis kona]|uniref:Nuclear protein localization protein n=1 Tax=Acrasis kona TaxID=1008807 RepID=A0AAW2YNJ4_9EUKA
MSKQAIKQPLAGNNTANVVTIRARGKDGTFRFDLKPNDTIDTVANEISKQTGVPPHTIKVSLDPKLLEKSPLSNKNTITQCGIKRGDMLHFAYDPTLKSKQDVQEEERKRAVQEEMGEGDDLSSLGLRHRKKNWTLAEYMKLREEVTIRIKHQKFGVCTTVSVDNQSANAFQLFLREMAMTAQRMAFLYGTFEKSSPPQDEEAENEKTTEEYVIENDEYEAAIANVAFEPKQRGTAESFHQIEDANINDRADTLASLLGMRRVGWIFSHDGSRDYPLCGEEIIKAAEYQSKYGPAFVTITVFPNEEGQLEFQAFQVSKQCVEMYEKGLLRVDPDNAEVMKTTKPVQVERKETQEIDSLLLICNVAIKNYTSKLQVGFPIRNRPSSDHVQNMTKLKQVLLARKNQKFVQRVSDFHMLLFLTEFLSLNSDFPPLCDAILRQDNDGAQNFEPLINGYAGLD